MLKRVLAAALALGLAGHAAAQDLRPDQARFRDLYKELVETNTSLSVGSCTVAAAKMGAHLKAAGFTDAQLTYFSVPDHPREGGLVAIYPGTSKTARPMLLLGHLDVVEAKRADWTRDPFKFIEENGYYYGRGTSDMKVIDATWVDMLIRFKGEHYQPKRTIKLALTCGEETLEAFNGADYLAKNKRDLIDAAFALNEGGGGRADKDGRVQTQAVQVGEKVVQQFRMETTNPGGHSSVPIKDNAIYQLAQGLLKVRDYDFPLQMNDTTRAFFAKAGAGRTDATGQAMVAIAKDPNDKAAEAILNRDRGFHSMLRTTCVATLLDGGHAENALPQRAGANINCRMFPGDTMEDTKAKLEAAIGDPGVKLIPLQPIRAKPTPPPLDPKIIGPMEKVAAKYWPGVPLVPTMSTGASDAIYLSPVGIPTYGVPGFYSTPEGSGAHGLNEHMSVKSAMIGRDYLTDLVKTYADED
ncbi:MAG TPA: M20/M25/M40 family metallo-hydrolase [Phenylobacterium sp.]|jgi:acetylornithine deacetylase/succinyl-diaminopimelate desuccinylase-like protein|uniref:M20/M25/M40 family metallo-hydrolase n=1 Tax=Phenylobacterium sp. TaxID=1871053 RepID=UPI002D697CDA|nr:M20/M25/M40 family metallo-hydrolase [Phenylobacterium sp.]HZZ68703.1 M20/M25/M40 family metallo-hydrolase [Phenylobacterium sp.]